MAEQTVARGSESSSADREGTRAQEQYVAPAVDIYETDDGLVLLADLPGVAKEDLAIRIDQNVLTLQGRARPSLPGQPVTQEFQLVNFFRQFELGETVDQASIQAELKHGVLTLHLPKPEEAKPRQIEVQVH